MKKSLERQVRERARECCEYCRLPQDRYPLPFPIDHIIARQHGGGDAVDNLALACVRCNLRKGPNLAGINPETNRIVRLFNPRRDRWSKHFAWDGPRLHGLTTTGRVTVSVLDINHPDAVALRAALIEEGGVPSGLILGAPSGGVECGFHFRRWVPDSDSMSYDVPGNGPRSGVPAGKAGGSLLNHRLPPNATLDLPTGSSDGATRKGKEVPCMLFAYFGPETYLPLSSTLVAVVGFLLMCGRMTWRWMWLAIGSIGRVFRPRSRERKIPAPHVLSQRRQLEERDRGSAMLSASIADPAESKSAPTSTTSET